ncbi:MAG: beta-ketoacyl synthase [Bacteroidales bacterium]|jgi:3-oxoacyl-[acyl-carrier-protein] synthase-1|nr:beta-ketoacyl synthase [Bacteroidales bacterium]
MIKALSDNIISSLGFDTEENYFAAKQGRIGTKIYDDSLSEPFRASFINMERLNDEFATISKVPYTKLEKAAILSIHYCYAERLGVDLSSDRTLFVFSSTKGNVDLLGKTLDKDDNSIYLWHSAKRITTFFNNRNTPLTVSNACISGAVAQVVAMRNLQSRRYDYAVVCGMEVLSEFIISGFQSFKSLSTDICKPFDAHRCGLNLGEAASTILYARDDDEKINIHPRFTLIKGAVRNDATHISAPSRTGEGSFRALKTLLQGENLDNIAFINAHGTATLYNDAMEAQSVTRMGLNDIPVTSLKGYFGHTLGAAGVLESIISGCSLREKLILPTKGFETPAQDCSLNVAKETMRSEKPYFVKMLSGFGGCNAVLLFK